MRNARQRNILVAAAAVAWASAIATASVAQPLARVKLSLTTSTYADGRYVTGHANGAVPDVRIFTTCIAAAFLGAAAVSASSKVAEACFFGLQAAATYATLGGTTMVAALLSAVLTFTSALSDGFFVLMLALLATLWDACFASAPQVRG